MEEWDDLFEPCDNCDHTLNSHNEDLGVCVRLGFTGIDNEPVCICPGFKYKRKSKSPAVDVERALYLALYDIVAEIYSGTSNEVSVGAYKKATDAVRLYESKGKL
jgi:hypothetical protein